MAWDLWEETECSVLVPELIASLSVRDDEVVGGTAFKGRCKVEVVMESKLQRQMKNAKCLQ